MFTRQKVIKLRHYSLFFLLFIGFSSVGFPPSALGQQKGLRKISEKVLKQNGKVKFGIDTKGDPTAANMIEVTENEILFYGANGNIIARREHKHHHGCNFSKQGKYLDFADFLTEAEPGGQRGIYVFRLLNNKNQVLWERTGEYDYEYSEGGEGPTRVEISDKNGTCVLFKSPWVFEMYDSSGQLIKTVKLLEGDPKDKMDISYDWEWSENGEFFAIITQERASRIGVKPGIRTIKSGEKIDTIQMPSRLPISGNPWVFLFDSNGNEIWRRRIPSHEPVGLNGVQVSPKGRFVIAKGCTHTIDFGAHSYEIKRNTYIFDRQDEIVYTFNNFIYVKNEGFSEDDELGLFIVGGDRVLLFDFFARKILWEKTFPEDIYLCTISHNKEKYAIATKVYKDGRLLPKIYIFDKKSIKISESPLFDGKYLKYSYKDIDYLKFSSDDKQLHLRLEGKIVSYRIEE